MTVRRHFVPAYLLERIAERGQPPAADRARRAVVLDEQLRARRPGTLPRHAAATTGEPSPRRRVSDAAGSTTLPGHVVREEADPATGDVAADEAFDGLGATWRLLQSEFGRDSLDGAGLPLEATVHYGQDYANAFWDGERMVLGDGDGEYFGRFTASIDVIGHELAHGLTDATSRLTYQGQPGALNESVSDVVGAMVAQHVAGQDAQDADWLIGAGLFTDRVQGVALRSMLRPGTAYDDPVLGRDPQPDSMAGYVETTDDNGGVHINSGIPNRAFALAATHVGGPAWEGAGAVWMAVLLGGQVRPDCDFETFAGLCVDEAGRRFGNQSQSALAVARGWRSVGVLGTDVTPARGTAADGASPSSSAPVVVVGRSGGVTGMSAERRMNLATLPSEEAARWSELLGSGVLAQLEPARPQPDRYVYRVRCQAASLDVTAGEGDLPDDVRSMIDAALRRDA